jgi:hypothetical protein
MLPLGFLEHTSVGKLWDCSRLAQFWSEKEDSVTVPAKMAVTQLKATARTITVFMVNDAVSLTSH